MNAEITAALNAYKPNIAESYKRSMRNLFEDIVALHGPSMRGLSNCFRFAKVFRSSGLDGLVRATDAKDERGWSIKEFDAARLDAAAAKVADLTVENWAGKIEAKLSELDEATAHYVGAYSFRISGKRGGHAIRIEQQMIINVSRLGKLFNQWPSRICVDGKATSEAAYKKMFKAAKAAA